MKLAQLLAGLTNGEIPECRIHGLQNDSRCVKPGDLFLAYAGATADGRLFIRQALAKGAGAVVYDPFMMPMMDIPQAEICIPVEQLKDKLAAIASRFYQFPAHALKVTGVTGTNGKTTIAYQLAQAHEQLGSSAAYIGTLGQGRVDDLKPLMNTTPDALCLQKILHEHQSNQVKNICMEVSSHALELGRVECIDFNQAIFTNLTHDHLDFHKTMEDYARAKAKLFANSTLEYAIINQDDEYHSIMSRALPSTCRLLTYGLSSSADVHAVNWHTHMQGSDIEASTPWGVLKFHVSLLGAFNIYNSLAVLTSLLVSGYPVADALAIMPQLHASPGRMEVVAKNPCVIVDYAHTPDALKNVLMTLQRLKKNKLWVVFGCGGNRDTTKRPLMGKIAGQYADHVIITSDNPRHEDPARIMQDIESGIESKIHVRCIQDRQKAIEEALHGAQERDIVLIAGKGHENYQQIGDERFSFSDQDIVRTYMQVYRSNQ